MGLGKTVQVLALLTDRCTNGPSLVVAPASVCHNWHSEAARFAPGLKAILFGEDGETVDPADLKASEVLIISYGRLQKNAELFAETRFTTTVLDESQNIKNADTKRWRAVCQLQSDFRIALSGTPVENHTEEIWSLFAYLTPDFLAAAKGSTPGTKTAAWTVRPPRNWPRPSAPSSCVGPRTRF